MSKTKILPAVVSLGNAQQQVAVIPVSSKHIALGARVTLAQTISITPGTTH